MKFTLKNKSVMFTVCLFYLITMLIVPNLVLAKGVEECNVQSNIQPRWSYLIECDNILDYATNISRGVKVAGSTMVNSGYAGVSIQLEKYIDSCQCWVNVPTYYWESYAEDQFACVDEDDISLSTGTYRLALLHTAYNTNGIELEFFDSYSNEITIR